MLHPSRHSLCSSAKYLSPVYDVFISHNIFSLIYEMNLSPKPQLDLIYQGECKSIIISLPKENGCGMCPKTALFQT